MERALATAGGGSSRYVGHRLPVHDPRPDGALGIAPDSRGDALYVAGEALRQVRAHHLDTVPPLAVESQREPLDVRSRATRENAD